MTNTRLNLFRDYARRRWGENVYKISLHTGVRCPHRERGGCAFCSPDSYTPYYLNSADTVPEQIRKGKSHIRHISARLYFACFQHETSTAGDSAGWLPMVPIPLRDPDCVGLTISTRPDFVDAATMEMLRQTLEPEPPKPVIVELGLQSARESSLDYLNRGHALSDFARAAEVLRRLPRFELGAHLILGIPGESLEDMRNSVRYIAEQGVRHLKLHHLQIVKGTPLFDRYVAAPFPLPTVEEYFEWLAELIPWIPREVIVHRLWSTCTARLLYRPRWNLESTRLYDRLSRMIEARGVVQGRCAPLL